MPNIIGFFCGTGFTTDEDHCYQALRSRLSGETRLFGYDGRKLRHGFYFAWGVENPADAFIKELEQISGRLQVHLIAFSRGVISALFVILKIQASENLRERVTVNADFRDPVPGNFLWSPKVFGHYAIANRVCALSACAFVKKVMISLQTVPTVSLAFAPLIPQFHHATEVTVEVLPGGHEGQHVSTSENEALFQLGLSRMMTFLIQNGHELTENVLSQVDCYTRLLNAAQSEIRDRNIHFKGSILTHPLTAKAVNWRHALLQEQPVQSVLFGLNHPHYNFRKSKEELHCDLLLALERFLVQHPNHEKLVNALKDKAKALYESRATALMFRRSVESLLSIENVESKELHRALNYCLMPVYLENLTAALKKIKPEHPFYLPLQALVTTLIEALDEEMASGADLKKVAKSPLHGVMKETVSLIEKLNNPKTMYRQNVLNQYATKVTKKLETRCQARLKKILDVFIFLAMTAFCLALCVGFCALGVGLAASSNGVLGLFLSGTMQVLSGAVCFLPLLGMEVYESRKNHWLDTSLQKNIKAHVDETIDACPCL